MSSLIENSVILGIFYIFKQNVMEKKLILFGLLFFSGFCFASTPKILLGELPSNVIQVENEVFTCILVTVVCPCNTYTTQWCDQGLHGTLSEWGDRVCSGCNEPEEEEGGGCGC